MYQSIHNKNVLRKVKTSKIVYVYILDKETSIESIPKVQFNYFDT